MFIIGILLGAVVVIFVLQNIAPVSVSLFAWQFDGSLAVVILLAVIAGMLISWLLSIPTLLKLSDMRNHNKKLQKDLEVHKQKLSETEGKLSQAETPLVMEKTVIVEKENI